MEIYKMMVLSTGHISKETAKLLEEDKVGVVVYPKDEYGWFIVVTDWNGIDADPVPDDLAECLKIAEENGCDWLCLDCDGETVENLPIYQW